MKTHKCLDCGVKMRKRQLYCRSCARRHNPSHKTRVVVSKFRRN
jgi:hypothetical protein